MGENSRNLDLEWEAGLNHPDRFPPGPRLPPGRGGNSQNLDLAWETDWICLGYPLVLLSTGYPVVNSRSQDLQSEMG